MKNHLLVFSFLIVAFAPNCFATTWNEPWQEDVVKKATSHVLARVTSFDESKGITIQIVKTLAGNELSGNIEITNFYLLDLRSGSGHGPEFHFEGVDSCYFFLAKDDQGKFCISTPTSGFDVLSEGKVYATYRHSYHQTLIRQELYEMTMPAIFKKYHGEQYDNTLITEFISASLSKNPASFDPNEIDIFFNQHVAMECAYHLGSSGNYDRLIIFLHDNENFHNRISAARALVSYNSDNCKKELLNQISDKNESDFTKVVCIATLQKFRPTELKSTLRKMTKKASEEHNGFGGNIMDPRVGTYVPSVKAALEELVSEL